MAAPSLSNRTIAMGDLTKELMKRSQVAQAHSTTYHPQTNGLVERQNRTLVSMLRVFCSRYMDDWDKHLPSASDGCLQQHGAFHHGNKSAHDANGSRKSAYVDVFLP